MSYTPMYDGPPVSELLPWPEDGCPGACETVVRDRYYADRWGDDAPDCYVWTCACGSWIGEVLS
jgi:hypothetical protein